MKSHCCNADTEYYYGWNYKHDGLCCTKCGRIDLDDVGASEHDWAGWASVLSMLLALIILIAVITRFV